MPLYDYEASGANGHGGCGTFDGDVLPLEELVADAIGVGRPNVIVTEHHPEHPGRGHLVFASSAELVEDRPPARDDYDRSAYV